MFSYDFYKKKSSQVNEKDLAKIVAPKYAFTNVQFGRINRETVTEIDFNDDFINQNTNLFLILSYVIIINPFNKVFK